MLALFGGIFAFANGQNNLKSLSIGDAATYTENFVNVNSSRAGVKGSFTYMPVETIKENFDIAALNFMPTGNPIVLGDINGDGFSDFAVSATAADERTADLSDKCSKSIIYYGNAAVTLKYSIVYSKLYPAGDMNKDGIDDVIAEYYDGSRKLLYGGVDGFTESTAFIPSSVGAIIGGVYDFDKDGHPDLLYRTSGYYCGILFGNSDPAKVTSVDFNYYYYFSFINVEGKTVVISNGINGLYLVSFNPDRTITKVKVSSEIFSPEDKFYNQDIDCDGSSDFFRIGNGTMYIYPKITLANNPDLTTFIEVSLPSGVILVPMGDINRDGRVEFVNFGSSPYDVYRYNNGVLERIGEANRPFVSIYNPLNNVLFDFNKDGIEDYLLVGSDEGFYGNRMLLGSTDNTFSIAKFQFATNNFIRDNGDRVVSLGDINGDGKIEVGIVNPYGVKIYHSDNLSAAIGDITHKEVGLQANNAVSGDINNDGFSDLILSYWCYGDFSKNIIKVYLGGHDGLFLSKTINVKDLLGLTSSDIDNNMAEFSYSLIGSIDGDALPEFVMSYSLQSKLYFFKGDKDFLSIVPTVFDANSTFGDSNFSEGSAMGYVGSRGASNMGDLNGDGINDFMIDHWGKGFATNANSGALYIFYGNTELNFTTPDLILYDNQPDHKFSFFGFSTAVGDFNGDGVKDIATVPSSFNKTDNSAYAGLYIYYGGSKMSNAPDKTFYLPYPNSTTGLDENVKSFNGLFQTVPDLNGDSADELLIFKNRNYLFMGGAYMVQDSLPAAEFSSEIGVSFSLPTNAYNSRFNAAFGDFQHKGVPELISIQNNNNFKKGTIQHYLVTNPYNKAPEGIEASSLAIPENKPDGTVVGTLTAVDVDKVDFHNFALTQNDSHAENSLFKIEGNKLIAIPSFDFEVKSSYTIMVMATDASGLSIEKEFAVSITNVNEAPENLALSATVVAENAVASTVVGTLSAQDSDAGDALTYTFAPGNGQNDSGNSFFEIAGNALKAKQPFDFEIKNSYSILVRATDNGGLSIEKELTVLVTNVNEAPENLALSATVVAENAVAGTVVGILSAQDIDAGDALTYAFASGNGQNDSGNSFFEIEGNVLKSKQPFDFETKNSYSIFVKATDNGGLSIEKEFVVTVTDAVETGIEDGVLNAISVYPNPASERVFVTLPVLANSISVVFTDLSGRMVYQGQFSGMQKVECSLSGVTGTVLVKVVADGKVYTSKVIAQ